MAHDDTTASRATRSKTFRLGEARLLADTAQRGPLNIPSHHFVTHGVVVGMTGSGKTGLVTVLAEEALRTNTPVLIVDVKGDLPNLLLSFPSFDPADLEPFVSATRGPDDARSDAALAREIAETRRAGLRASGVNEADVRAFAESTSVRVITPGSSAGESLHLLSSLERPSPRWEDDPEAARESLEAAVSLVLRLLGREADPAKSREHVVLATLAERRLSRGESADVRVLIEDLESPPIETIGAMSVDAYLSKPERHALAASMNSLLASSSLASWRRGATLDVGEWLTPKDGRTPAVIVSVAHLDDDERALVLGVVLHEVLAWVRSLSGSQGLRAMVLFDEVYGFVPPHPANPPTKKPLVSLMKQARAFGVGVVIATQNPMDLDYRALGNAGVWCIGRLQTDADRKRVVEGMTGGNVKRRGEGAELAGVIKRLAPRWFVLRDAHANGELVVVRPRDTITWMRGPMTRVELGRALRARS